ncbi:MAG: hypothetical protein HQK89_00495 [Nitrospirae bacterium]|nr:hypothetical protein [Nitrospirota bacterium]
MKMEARVDVLNFINFLKSSFYATLDNIYEIQELSEKVLLEMAKSGKHVQEEAEKVLTEFLENSKRSRDEFKNVMDSGFKQVEDVFKATHKTDDQKSDDLTGHDKEP